MDTRIATDLEQRYLAAAAWIEQQTTGHPDLRWWNLLAAIDKALAKAGGKRHRPRSQHEAWFQMARWVLTTCQEAGVDAIEYVLGQIDSRRGARWLIEQERPITPTLFTSDKAVQRFGERQKAGKRERRNVWLTRLQVAAQSFAEAYFLDLKTSLSEADAAAHDEHDTWDRAKHDRYPHLRWLLHQHAVYLLDGDLRHVPVLDAPEEGWSYPGERLRLLRLIAQHRPAPVEEPRPRRRAEPLPEDLGTVFSAEDMGQISDEDDEDDDE